MTDKFYFTPLARCVFEVWGYTTKIAVLATNYSMEWHSMIDEQIKEPLAGWGELITNWIRSYSSTRLIGWLWTKRQYAWWTERASMHLTFWGHGWSTAWCSSSLCIHAVTGDRAEVPPLLFSFFSPSISSTRLHQKKNSSLFFFFSWQDGVGYELCKIFIGNDRFQLPQNLLNSTMIYRSPCRHFRKETNDIYKFNQQMEPWF